MRRFTTIILGLILGTWGAMASGPVSAATDTFGACSQAEKKRGCYQKYVGEGTGQVSIWCHCPDLTTDPPPT